MLAVCPTCRFRNGSRLPLCYTKIVSQPVAPCMNTNLSTILPTALLRATWTALGLAYSIIGVQLMCFSGYDWTFSCPHCGD